MSVVSSSFASDNEVFTLVGWHLISGFQDFDIAIIDLMSGFVWICNIVRTFFVLVPEIYLTAMPQKGRRVRLYWNSGKLLGLSYFEGTRIEKEVVHVFAG